MTTKEAKKLGFKNYDPAIRAVPAWHGNDSLDMITVDLLNPSIHFPTRAKLRAANKAKRTAAATARQEASMADRKAKDDKFHGFKHAKFPGFKCIGFSGTESGNTDIYEVFRLDGTMTTVSDAELAKNDGKFFPSEEAARLARIEGYRKAGGRITSEQAKDLLADSSEDNEFKWYSVREHGTDGNFVAYAMYSSSEKCAALNGDVANGSAYLDKPSAAEEARKRRIAWRRENQMTPITEEQAKDLREGEQFFMLLHGRVEETSCAELARECLSPVQTSTDLATGAVVTRPQTFSGSYYWSRKAADAALDKQAAEPVNTTDKWIERKKGDPITRGDQWTENTKVGSQDEPVGCFSNGARARDGWVYSASMEWTIKTGEKGFRARYHNPLWLAKHGKSVESHKTPLGETQAKEVVTDETQRSTSRPLSDAEFKKLVGRMSLPQLYDALKANGVELEGVGLEPKKVDEQSVLKEAEKCVTGPRRRDYGTPDENFGLIASLWSVQLKHEVTPMQVAMCLILLKVARQSNSPKRDNLVDIAGYAQCASELKGAK